MRRLQVFGAVLVVGTGLVAALEAAPGFAREDAVTAIQQGWAWRLQDGQAPSLSPVSGIREGQLPVAWSGEPDKLTYLGIAPREPDAPTRLAGLTLEIDRDAHNVNLAEARLIACSVTTEWQPAGPMAWEDRPDDGCDDAAEPGVFEGHADRFYFDMSALGPELHSPDTHGLVIAPHPGSGATAFQVVFRSARDGGAIFTTDSRAAPAPAPTPSPVLPASRTATPTPPAAEPPQAGLRPAPAVETVPTPGPSRPLVAETDTNATLPRTPASPAPVASAARERTVSLSGVYLALAALGSLGVLGRAGHAAIDVLRASEEAL